MNLEPLTWRNVGGHEAPPFCLFVHMFFDSQSEGSDPDLNLWAMLSCPTVYKWANSVADSQSESKLLINQYQGLYSQSRRTPYHNILWNGASDWHAGYGITRSHLSYMRLLDTELGHLIKPAVMGNMMLLPSPIPSHVSIVSDQCW